MAKARSTRRKVRKSRRGGAEGVTVAELIEKLTGVSDKSMRVYMSDGGDLEAVSGIETGNTVTDKYDKNDKQEVVTIV